MKRIEAREGAAVAIGRITPGQGCMAALLTLLLTIGISGCSHSKKQTVSSNQDSTTQQQSAQLAVPAVPVGPAPVTSQPETPKKKKAVKRLSATRTYTDANSGLSFTYPRRSTLEVGDKAEEDGLVAQQMPMNFAEEGGVTVAVVELPGMAKSGTEFTPALFTISLNKELTAEQCSGFSASDSGSKSTDNSVEKPVVSTDVSKQTISGVEYTELDKQTDHGLVKYYHRFVPGITPDDNACYEFAMSVKPLEQKQGDDKAAESSDLEHKDVQENAAFAGLEKILASVNFKGELKSEGIESAKSEKQPIGDKQ